MENHRKDLSQGWRMQLSDGNENGKMWQGQESGGDSKERSEEIVNRLTSRLASNKSDKSQKESLRVSKSSENKQDWAAVGRNENKNKEFTGDEKESNGSAIKELKYFNDKLKNTKSKVHERVKEQDSNDRLEGLVGKSRTNEKLNKYGSGAEKKDNLKRKFDKDKDKMKQYFNKNKSSNFYQQPSAVNGKSFNPNQDSDCALKKEERVIFCNGVKVVVTKPERKIALEKKNEKISLEKRIEKGFSLVRMTASEQVYTRVDRVSFNDLAFHCH